MIRPGDVLDVRSGGGGGFGDPAERSAAEHARDRRLGFVTDAGPAPATQQPWQLDGNLK